jgi:hypothetical protein
VTAPDSGLENVGSIAAGGRSVQLRAITLQTGKPACPDLLTKEALTRHISSEQPATFKMQQSLCSLHPGCSSVRFACLSSSTQGVLFLRMSAQCGFSATDSVCLMLTGMTGW